MADPQQHTSRAIRLVAWVVILALAVFQTCAWRHAMSPDGMSYLDLSDAVTNGRWSELVNLYWSPLYPALIGVARAVLHPAPYWEFATAHLVTLACLVATFLAFEYFLAALLALARDWPRSPLATRLGIVAAYTIFGAFALTMTSMELVTPDLLVAAAALVVFGALLRATQPAASETALARLGLVVGAALGVGALAKSFLVPWGIVCVVVFAIATRRAGPGPTLRAAVLWAVFVIPWTIMLSRAAGRLTFGDAGRLTFAWYVNGQEVPSLGGVPPGARTPAVQAILPGAGITGNAPGTDPMWYDPARWNVGVAPHWSFAQQRDTVYALVGFYIQNLTPLFFALLLIAVAEPGTRRLAWLRGWVIFIPVLAGLAAYASVIVTTRYIMAFLLAGTLMLVAALPWPRRLIPRHLLLGIVLALGLETLAPRASVPLAVMAAVLAGLVVASLVPDTSRTVWVIVTVLGAVVARVLLPASLPTIVRVGAVLVALVLWARARAAVRAHRTVTFSRRIGSALALLLVFLIVFRLGIRLSGDAQPVLHPPSGPSANVPWAMARDLADHGVTPGAGIAVIGSADQAYWARVGRLHIVADVPEPTVGAFWSLPRSSRERLLSEFAAAGARYAVASEPPPSGVPDSSWTPTRYRGLVRRLCDEKRQCR